MPKPKVALVTAGLNTGDIDGTIGAATRAAMMRLAKAGGGGRFGGQWHLGFQARLTSVLSRAAA